MKKDQSELVYTTDPEEAKRLRAAGALTPARDLPPQQQDIRVMLDRKRRGGKTVTVATGFQLAPATLEKLGGQLKKRCGSGGTAKDGEIEVQGDHVDTVMAELSKLGYRVKRSGG